MIQTEKLAYGIGITADYSDVDLGTRDIDAGSIENIPGATECEIESKELGIKNNALFTYLVENAKDCFEITIDSSTSSRAKADCKEAEVERSPTSTEISRLTPFARDDVILFPLKIKATSDTAMAYIKIIVKSGTTVTIHEQITPKDMIGCIIDVILEEGASVTYIADQRVREDTSVLVLRRAFVKQDASVKWIDLAIGASIANSSIYTMLEEPGAVGKTYGLFYGRAEQLHDINHTTIHRAPYTISNMKTNGVLDEKAKAVYRSLIDIRENALNSDGHQKEETLLLSREAQISSVPDLEIANSEVVCSHGVSTTNIEDASLFYFHSRGMDTETAKQAIVEGHLGVILDEIEDESIKLRIYDEMYNRTRI